MLLYDRNIIVDSSEIFGNLRKMSEKCSETFALLCLACGHEFYLLVFNSTSHSFAALTREISS